MKLKCHVANSYVEEIKDFSRSDAEAWKKEELDKTKERLENTIKTCLGHTQEIQDDFYRSAALHSIADLLSKAGQYNRASKIIELIAVDFIQEKAKAFLTEKENENISTL